MKVIKLDSLYHDYGLYSEIYQKDIQVKAFESVNVAIAMEQFVREYYPNCPGLRVTETHAGQSEHIRYTKEVCAVPITAYTPTDAFPSKPGVVRCNVQTDGLPRGNFVVSHYMSLATAINGAKGYPDRKTLLAVCRNVYNSLTEPGAWFFNSPQSGLDMTLFAVDEHAKEKYSFWAHPKGLIRRELGLTALEKCELKCETRSIYNRMIGCVEFYVDKVDVVARGKCMRRYTVRKPMYQRFWSEPELVDVLLEAGFNDVEFFRNEIDGTYVDTHDLLDKKITVREPEEELDTMLSTDMMALKLPKGKSRGKRS